MAYQPSSPNPNYDGVAYFQQEEDVLLHPKFRSESITPVSEFNRSREVLRAETESAFHHHDASHDESQEFIDSNEMIISAATSVGRWLQYVREEELRDAA